MMKILNEDSECSQVAEHVLANALAKVEDTVGVTQRFWRRGSYQLIVSRVRLRLRLLERQWLR